MTYIYFSASQKQNKVLFETGLRREDDGKKYLRYNEEK